MDIYKYAAQNKLRIVTSRGEITVEQLFEMALRREDGFDLDNVARDLSRELKTSEQESFVEVSKPDPRKVTLEVAFEIVLDVIRTKQDAQKAELQKQQKNIQRRKILDAKAAQMDRQLSEASIEELDRQLAALDD